MLQEDYWATEHFKAQPAYRFGKVLRKISRQGYTNIINYLIEIQNALYPLWRKFTQSLSDIKNLFWHKNQTDETLLYSTYAKESESLNNKFIGKEENEILKTIKAIGKHADRVITSQLINEYYTLEKYIDVALAESKKTNKPLAILLAEEHGSENAALIEGLILLMLRDKISLSDVFTEAPSGKYVLKKPYRESYNCPEVIDTSIENMPCIYTEIYSDTSVSVSKLAQKLNIKKVPIDYASCFVNEKNKHHNKYLHQLLECEGKKNQYEQVQSNALSLETIWLRDQGMVMGITEHNTAKKTVLAIVGGLHIHGMTALLKKDYHVLPIEVSNFKNIVKDKKFVESQIKKMTDKGRIQEAQFFLEKLNFLLSKEVFHADLPFLQNHQQSKRIFKGPYTVDWIVHKTLEAHKMVQTDTREKKQYDIL